MSIDIDAICKEGIDNITKDILELKQRVEHSRKEPRTIIEGVFNDKHFANGLTGTLKVLDISFHVFQSEIYKPLMGFLKEEFGDDYCFTFNKNYYPAMININYKKDLIAYINIKNEELVKMNPFKVNGLLEEIKYYKNKIENKSVMLDILEKEASLLKSGEVSASNIIIHRISEEERDIEIRKMKKKISKLYETLGEKEDVLINRVKYEKNELKTIISTVSDYFVSIWKSN